MKRIFLGLITLMFWGSGLAYAGDYINSAHGQNINRNAMIADPRYNPAGGVGYGTGNCAHCHEAHASLDGTEPAPSTTSPDPGPDQVLLFSEEETLCEYCHDGSPVTGNIKAQIDKTYAHPTDDYFGVHKVSESTTTDMEPGDYDPDTSLHAECVDCHNPHAAGDTPHTKGTNTVTSTSPIYKVSGVNPPVTSAWATPTATSYTEKPTGTGIDFEYELCYKCHSSWTGTGSDDPVVRDTAKEFNYKNASFHPVELNLGDASSGSSALDADQMLAPWKVGMGTASQGTKTMYCSDCHGSETSSDPAGPHGSTNPKILKGRWPENSSGYLWDLDDADGTPSHDFDQCLCKNCHPIYPWQNEAHATSRHSGSYKCVYCHVGLPHGSNLGRLIADSDLGHPYDYDGNARITGFTKASPPKSGYRRGDCDAGCTWAH